MARGEPDTLLSVAQAAALLGVHPNTIRLWTDAGRLTAYRINARGDRRFRRTDVEHLLVETAAGPSGSSPGEAAGDGRHTDRELRVFGRIAAGLATTPSPGAVARVIVEAVHGRLPGVELAAHRLDDHPRHRAR